MVTLWCNRSNCVCSTQLHGFLLVHTLGFVNCRKVTCIADSTEELILAYFFLLPSFSRFDNFIAPYSEMSHQLTIFKNKLSELCEGICTLEKQVNVYYDDPRYTTGGKYCRCLKTLAARWAIAYEVPEEVLDILALNSISYVRIPPGTCLKYVS